MADYGDKKKPYLEWEAIDSGTRRGRYDWCTEYILWRTPIPNGWLVKNETGQIIYIPDGAHKWVLKNTQE